MIKLIRTNGNSRYGFQLRGLIKYVWPHHYTRTNDAFCSSKGVKESGFIIIIQTGELANLSMLR